MKDPNAMNSYEIQDIISRLEVGQGLKTVLLWLLSQSEVHRRDRSIPDGYIHAPPITSPAYWAGDKPVVVDLSRHKEEEMTKPFPSPKSLAQEHARKGAPTEEEMDRARSVVRADLSKYPDQGSFLYEIRDDLVFRMDGPDTTSTTTASFSVRCLRRLKSELTSSGWSVKKYGRTPIGLKEATEGNFIRIEAKPWPRTRGTRGAS